MFTALNINCTSSASCILVIGSFLFLKKHTDSIYIHIQGRQSVPKSGRSERGGARNFVVYQTIAPKNLLFKGYFCPEQRLSAMNFRGGAEKW